MDSALPASEKCTVCRRATLTHMDQEFLKLVRGRRGHFLYESGHHAELWFDLETLCQRPAGLRPYIAELSARLQPYRPALVCGPLVEGAFIGLLVAAELGCEFTYALRSAAAKSTGLFSVQYRLPPVLGPAVRGRRVAIVNDVISAGSAVRGTYRDLRTYGAEVAAVGSLIVLGEEFSRFAADKNLAVESLAQWANPLWTPAECPLCRAGVPLERLAND